MTETAEARPPGRSGPGRAGWDSALVDPAGTRPRSSRLRLDPGRAGWESTLVEAGGEASTYGGGGGGGGGGGWLVGWWLVGWWLVVVMGLATGKEAGWALIQVMRPSPFRRVTEHAMRACGSGPHAINNHFACMATKNVFLILGKTAFRT